GAPLMGISGSGDSIEDDLLCEPLWTRDGAKIIGQDEVEVTLVRGGKGELKVSDEGVLLVQGRVARIRPRVHALAVEDQLRATGVAGPLPIPVIGLDHSRIGGVRTERVLDVP